MAYEMGLYSYQQIAEHFDVRLRQYRKELGIEFGDDALDEEIIAYAEEQTQKLGCFVAGTLVHTQDGLRPIEQIKVGDWVLSKPESGEGEVSYKRVLKTFDYDDREVWFLGFIPMENGEELIGEEDFLVVTSTHPIWVKELRDSDGELVKDISKWVGASKLFDEYLCGGECPIFELQDGRSARLSYAGPILRVANPDHGLVCELEDWLSNSEGILVDFSGGCPQIKIASDRSPVCIEMDLEEAENYDDTDHQSIVSRTRYYPLLRKVYNFEVEDNRTYFVGRAGVLVHNTSGEALSKDSRL